MWCGGSSLEKVDKKINAFIHDACGFLIQHLEIGPGYIYGLFTKNMLDIGSGGSVHGFFSLLLLKEMLVRSDDLCVSYVVFNV